ncbi:MAG: cobalamin-dependent protein, partial [Eubacterium sp.]
MADLIQLGEFVVDGNEEAVQNAVNKALEEKVDPVSIINDGLLAGMNIVGEEFKKGEMYVPEVLMAARAMNVGMDMVKPLIADTDMPNLGTIVIGTVKGDLHDIGKNLVVMMLESAGFKIVDVGVDASPEDFVAAAVENNADIVAMSAMLTTTMQMMDKVVAACKDAGVEAQYLIGGAPV